MKIFTSLTYIACCLVLLVSTAGCVTRDDEYVEAKLTAVFDVPANLNPIETHYIIVRDVKALYTQTLATRGLEQKDIARVLAHRCRMYGRFGGTNLSIFSNISIRALSKDGNNRRSEMFYLDEIPFNGRSELQLLSSISELKPTMEVETFDLEIRLQIRGFVPTSIPLQIDFSYLAVLNK
ncbi:MAG TPA: hypothetical protein PKD85_12415 [Saprospiraceae bacterium]|nr:hypothetical protein [Saprospiraceae bacterium]